MNRLFDVTLHAGFTSSKTSDSALTELTKHKTAIMSDDGKAMVLNITTGDKAPKGFFTLLTDHKLIIKRVTEIYTVTIEETGDRKQERTNLKLPEFDTPIEVYRGGKVFYLYIAKNGPAATIGANRTVTYEIQYRSYRLAREPDYLYLTEMDAGTIDAPMQLKNNTRYILSTSIFIKNKSYQDNAGVWIFPPSIDPYIMLPDNAHLGDTVSILIVAGARVVTTTQYFNFYPASGGLINGYAYPDGYKRSGAGHHFLFIGGDGGWVHELTTPRI